MAGADQRRDDVIEVQRRQVGKRALHAAGGQDGDFAAASGGSSSSDGAGPTVGGARQQLVAQARPAAALRLAQSGKRRQQQRCPAIIGAALCPPGLEFVAVDRHAATAGGKQCPGSGAHLAARLVGNGPPAPRRIGLADGKQCRDDIGTGIGSRRPDRQPRGGIARFDQRAIAAIGVLAAGPDRLYRVYPVIQAGPGKGGTQPSRRRIGGIAGRQGCNATNQFIGRYASEHGRRAQAGQPDFGGHPR